MRLFYSSLLSASERSFYQNLDAAVRNKSASCSFPNGLNGDSVYKVVRAYTFEHPEIFYYPGIEIGGSGNTLNLRYLNSDRRIFDAKVNEAVAEIRKKLNGKTDEYSIVKAIYEYICLNYSYDRKLFDDYISIQNAGGDLGGFASQQAYGFTVYGFFVNKKAVCFGIAKGFKLLCDHFNIECMLVECGERLQDGSKGCPHIFNRVRVNGKESFIDCTYGLVTPTFPMLRYELFLASKEDVERFYVLDIELSGQVVKENYYVKKNVIFTKKYQYRMFLSSYDAVVNDHKIRIKYIGNDLGENELSDFTLEVLNRHAPRGKTWITNSLNGFLNGMLLSIKESQKLSDLSKEEN